MTERDRDPKDPVDTKAHRPSLRAFDAYADRNGQDVGQDSPTDVARPAELQHLLAEDPGGEAETARLVSGRSRLDSIEGGSIATSEATEAETPPEHVERISNPSLPRDRKSEDGPIPRATSGLGRKRLGRNT